MSVHIKRGLALVLCFAIMTGCSPKANDETDAENNKKDVTQSEEANAEKDAQTAVTLDSPELPGTLEDIIAYPVGEFSADGIQIQDETVQKELDSIPAFPEDASEEDLEMLFSHLYSLFKKEYTDPKKVLTGQSIDGPDQSESPEEKKGTFNVEIVLDSSGSMGNYMGSKTRMELAKDSIKKFASSLPEEANISMRVYGHKGTGSNEDKKLSCSSNELVYPLQPYDQQGLDEALGKFKPAGWTPLAQAIIEAQKDLSQYKGENNKNIVYIVSDGIETCGGDPIKAAKSLKDGVAPVVNIIGFDLNNKDQQQLQEVAQAAGGTYVNVKNQEQLQNEFEKTVEESAKWVQWSNEQTLNAIDKSNTQTLDIYNITNNWELDSSSEKAMITFALDDLQLKNKITNDQNLKILEMAETFYQKQWDALGELEDILINSTKEDLNKTLEKIDKIYDENVS
jgi:Ca-activated chloride channel homolog